MLQRAQHVQALSENGYSDQLSVICCTSFFSGRASAYHIWHCVVRASKGLNMHHHDTWACLVLCLLRPVSQCSTRPLAGLQEWNACIGQSASSVLGTATSCQVSDPVHAQFVELLKRDYTQYWRNIPYNGTRFAFSGVIGAIMGCILWSIGNRRYATALLSISANSCSDAACCIPGGALLCCQETSLLVILL